MMTIAPPIQFFSSRRVKYMDKIVFASLSINSIRNKFDMLTDLIRGNIDDIQSNL